DSTCLEPKRARTVFPRRDGSPVRRADRGQREHADSRRSATTAREGVLPRFHVARFELTWLRRVSGWAAIPDDQEHRRRLGLTVGDDDRRQLAAHLLTVRIGAKPTCPQAVVGGGRSQRWCLDSR